MVNLVTISGRYFYTVVKQTSDPKWEDLTPVTQEAYEKIATEALKLRTECADREAKQHYNKHGELLNKHYGYTKQFWCNRSKQFQVYWRDFTTYLRDYYAEHAKLARTNENAADDDTADYRASID